MLSDRELLYQRPQSWTCRIHALTSPHACLRGCRSTASPLWWRLDVETRYDEEADACECAYRALSKRLYCRALWWCWGGWECLTGVRSERAVGLQADCVTKGSSSGEVLAALARFTSATCIEVRSCACDAKWIAFKHQSSVPMLLVERYPGNRAQ